MRAIPPRLSQFFAACCGVRRSSSSLPAQALPAPVPESFTPLSARSSVSARNWPPGPRANRLASRKLEQQIAQCTRQAETLAATTPAAELSGLQAQLQSLSDAHLSGNMRLSISQQLQVLTAMARSVETAALQSRNDDFGSQLSNASTKVSGAALAWRLIEEQIEEHPEKPDLKNSLLRRLVELAVEKDSMSAAECDNLVEDPQRALLSLRDQPFVQMAEFLNLVLGHPQAEQDKLPSASVPTPHQGS